MTEHKLGRNIKDLIAENKVDFSENEEVLEVELYKIRPNPDQPRSVFDIKSIKELAESIREHGVIQPIILKPTNEGYTLVAGERRVRAAKEAGLKKIPSIVRDYNSLYLAELALLENLQREDLSPIEEAIAFSKMVSILHITHEELGKKVGKSRTYITNMLGLLNLPASIIEDVNSGILSMGHARSLSKLSDVILCLELRDKIIKENLSVRELENIIRHRKGKSSNRVVSSDIIKNVKTDLKNFIDNEIKYKVSNESISFKFKSEEELMKILMFLKRG